MEIRDEILRDESFAVVIRKSSPMGKSRRLPPGAILDRVTRPVRNSFKGSWSARRNPWTLSPTCTFADARCR